MRAARRFPQPPAMRVCRPLVLALTLAFAAGARGATGDEDTERWLRELRSPSLGERRSGALNVGNAAERARDTTPRLLEMLATETDPDLREAVVRALGLASKGMAGAPPALARVLGDDPSPQVRIRSAQALGALAEAPETAVPALAQALSDAEADVRRAAAEALGKFKGNADAVAALQKALDDRDIAWAAAASLGRLGPVSAPAVPALRQLAVAKEAEYAARLRALRALGQIGDAAKDATPECLQLLSGDDARLRVEAAIALLTFGRETGAALRVLNASIGFRGGSAASGDEFERLDVVSRAAWGAKEFAALTDGDTVARLAVAAEDPSRDIRRWAAPAFDTVLSALVQQRRFDALDSLAAARDFLAGSGEEGVRNRSRSVAAAVAELEAAQPLAVRLQRHAGRVAAGAAALLALAAFALRRYWRRAPKVFLGYRRGDSTAWCGRLYDRLETLLGEGCAFRDIESLEPGTRFRQQLRDRIAASDAFVAVIGPGWLAAADESGRRRIDDPEDFVRQEIETALAAGKPLFPVLVDGARMPAAAELPPPIAALASANAIPLTDAHFVADVAKLVKAIRAALRR